MWRAYDRREVGPEFRAKIGAHGDRALVLLGGSRGSSPSNIGFLARTRARNVLLRRNQSRELRLSGDIAADPISSQPQAPSPISSDPCAPKMLQSVPPFVDAEFAVARCGRRRIYGFPGHRRGSRCAMLCNTPSGFRAGLSPATIRSKRPQLWPRPNRRRQPKRDAIEQIRRRSESPDGRPQRDCGRTRSRALVEPTLSLADPAQKLVEPNPMPMDSATRCRGNRPKLGRAHVPPHFGRATPTFGRHGRNAPGVDQHSATDETTLPTASICGRALAKHGPKSSKVAANIGQVLRKH